MSWIDGFVERVTRDLAHRTSRRAVLTRLGGLLVGAASIPLLPVASHAAIPDGRHVPPKPTGKPEDPGNPNSCDYWRYCAIDGFLCSCCGGTANTCPPGTEMAPLTWIGTCQNPADGKHYVLSYNDCCGKGACQRCFCNRNEREKPHYRPQKNNSTHWCLGASSMIYNCSVAVIVGVAVDAS